MRLSHDERQSALTYETNVISHDSDNLESSVPCHPLGIKPLGNKYLYEGSIAREFVGTFKVLSDEVLAQFLEFLDRRTLRILGYTCKFLYAHSISEELWKALFLESELGKERSLNWLGTWRATLLQLPKGRRITIDCKNVFSDVLHRPFVCSHINLNQYASNIPSTNRIRRFEELSYEEFAKKWSETPFIMTKCIRSWPVFQSWSLDTLPGLYGNTAFKAEAVDWSLSTYYQYMFDNQDESPVYLFDRNFAESMDIKVGKEEGAAYWNPDCFGPDLFELLGPQRPAHRWLIIGPTRSGSTFHKDPNGTSAWNAVLQGSKYWIMFPPSVPVPGVYVSKDASEVTSPLSIAEWLLEFHAEARNLPQCVEGVCRTGEILHVPSGWWHLVVNLESCLALTQNFVPKSHLVEVLSFLKNKPEQVTGFKKEVVDPYGLFVNRLRDDHPDLLQDSLERLATKQVQKKRKWDLAVKDNDQDEDDTRKKSVGFSFGFGSGDEEDEIP